MTEASPPAKFQILLAEDDKVNQSIVQAFLFGVDMELTIASDGREALEAALTHRFDLMIVDQNMPFITGDRVIRHLRAGRSINAATPVIRFTADADFQPFDMKTVASSLEVTLPKPLSRQDLVSTVSALLGGALSQGVA
ncbi:MAG: response regulator [Cypionkella sp.]|uniref:response regulator n=2 Tax=Cypionkella sp. TaxID=2811411 RepID=UPI002ABB09DD|nr:response regulator [Cypionkella sp.]MDZ4313111.1 response regulator [Cypionkella sp.]